MREGGALNFEDYRAASRAEPMPSRPDWPARPNGECVWIHLGSDEDAATLLDLADRFHLLRGAITILITRAPTPDRAWPITPPGPYVILCDAPSEHPDAVDSFLDHWDPDVLLWVWGNLRPNLVHAAAMRGVATHLVLAEKAGFDNWSAVWSREMAQTLAACFETASARSAGGAQKIARFGVAPETIAVLAPLLPSGRILPYMAEEFDALSVDLNSRPVWLGAEIGAEEWQTVLAAHRLALRSHHRLLLVMLVAPGLDLAPVEAQMRRERVSYAMRSRNYVPDESTQVLIADLPDELGLWLRVAAVTYIGGTLYQGPGGRDPLLAASLGTAILHGPNTSTHRDSFTRLRSAGALDLVQDAPSLGNAVAHRIVPDQAAQMACAGWDVISEGSEVADAIIDAVQESLDGPAHLIASPRG